MFYITGEKRAGFVKNSISTDWEEWIGHCLPEGLHPGVRKRLISNLKHVMVALELKAGLIVPHGERGSGPSTLFEPYFQIMNFEFCVGVFSICEGLGSALWLRENKRDGAASNRIRHEEWGPSLVRKFDPTGKLDLSDDVNRVRNVRDKLHQDRLGARENIDWHAFSYADAFTPALRAMRCLFQTNAQVVPQQTNLRAQ
jgi:hypothetical protein